MLYYILQIIACQVLFLLVYDLFLKRETFFNYNRAYLLITALLSFVLPFIKIDSLKTLAPTDFRISLPEVIIGNTTQVSEANQLLAEQAGITLNQPNASIWLYLMILGMSVMTIIFSYKLIKIIQLKFNNPHRWSGNVLLVKILKSNTAFSFFNMVFLGEKISKEQKDIILKHELIHVKHYHTLDLLVFEVMRIFLWFNPLIYMYQNRIKTLHEFIADKNAIQQNDKHKYYKELLNQIFDTNNVSFTNSFFNKSLIKKRIIMLQKSKSKKVNALKYALLIPVVLGMLFYVSCEQEVTNSEELVSEIDLDQYSYKIHKDETMTSDVKKIRDKHEVFLASNKDYVGWANIDSKTEAISYSIHSKKEKVPEGFDELNVTKPNVGSYMMYMNLGLQNNKTKTDDKLEVKKLNSRYYNGKSEVPFSAIDKVPTSQNCQNATTEEERRKCIEKMISRYVARNFNVDLAETLGLPGGVQKIHTAFKIDKQGNVIDITARAPHPDLEAEAERVIGQLPKFIAGEHGGEKVVVQYSLPISFQIRP